MAYPYYGNYYPQYQYGYPQTQSYANNNIRTMEWVEGEVGAKAFQMPQGWPPETPIALWGNSEKKIYLKSWNQMGMPNPMQELDYEIKERTNPNLLPAGVSGEMEPQVTRKEFEDLKTEIHSLAASMQSAGSRGGSK